MNIVISYAREDRGLVEELVGTLRSFGHEPWTDAGAHSGGRWWNEIIQRIQVCDVLLLVMSPAYLTSKAGLLRGYLAHPNRMQEPAERAAAALQQAGHVTWGPDPRPPLPPQPAPAPARRSPLVTVLAVVGAIALLVIVLVGALSGGSGDPPAGFVPGAQVAQELAPMVYAQSGVMPAQVVCEDLAAVVGAQAGCVVTDPVGGTANIAVVARSVGDSVIWQWTWA